MEYKPEELDEDATNELIASVTKRVRDNETILQSKISKLLNIWTRFVQLEKIIENRVEKLQIRRESIEKQFDQINHNNQELNKKSKNLFRKLQFLSKKMSSSPQDQNLFGLLFQSNSHVRSKMKKELELDIRRVG